MEILREKDLLKASQIFEIPIDTLRRMNEQGLLNYEHIMAVIIRQDFLNYRRYIKGKDRYTEKEILIALSKEYRLQPPALRDIVYKNHNKDMVFCKQCSVRITPTQYQRTGGLCSTCNAETLPHY